LKESRNRMHKCDSPKENFETFTMDDFPGNKPLIISNDRNLGKTVK